MKKLDGFTLIELILVMLILGIGLSGVLSIMIASIKNSVTPELRWQVIMIGENITQMLLEQREPILPKQGRLEDLFPELSQQIMHKNMILTISTEKLATDESELINVKLNHTALGETHFSAIKTTGLQNE